MRALLASLVVFTLSLGAFALDESVTLRFLLKNSESHFVAKSDKATRDIKAAKWLAKGRKMDELGKAQHNKLMTELQCRADAYGMLLKITKKFKSEDALSSSFILRGDLDLKNDDLKSLFDFFVLPYLEYLNYKTDFLTAAVNKTNFRTNESMPFFISELNVDGYCERQSDLLHYGEDKTHPDLGFELPEAIVVNDVARSKMKIVDAEIDSLERYSRSAQTK